jgi:hypothetical protein
VHNRIATLGSILRSTLHHAFTHQRESPLWASLPCLNAMLNPLVLAVWQCITLSAGLEVVFFVILALGAVSAMMDDDGGYGLGRSSSPSTPQY